MYFYEWIIVLYRKVFRVLSRSYQYASLVHEREKQRLWERILIMFIETHLSGIGIGTFWKYFLLMENYF